MKQILSLILSFTLFFPLTACDTGESGSGGLPVALSEQTPEISTPAEDGSDSVDTNILVAYFSATGNTKVLAEYAADILSADLYEIQAQIPYTGEDLNYNDSSSRTSKEQNDSSARPEISERVENMERYDIVILGYPIWWGQAPKIVSTFLESYDFSGKTIVPFCTSGGSGIGSSDKNLHELCSDSTNWKDGRRLGAGTSKEDMSEWLNSLELVVETSSK